MFNLVLISHIHYALDNKLVETYQKIKSFFIKNDIVTNYGKSILEKYIVVTKDMTVLKASCVNNKVDIYWDCIDLMLFYNIEHEFCYKESLDFFNFKPNTEIENQLYEVKALNNLFKLNKIEAIRIFLKDLQSNRLDSLKRDGEYLKISNYKSYNVIDDYNMLEILFKEIYKDDFSDTYLLNNYKTFFKQYVFNLSSNDDGYKKVKTILGKIRLEKESNKEELFDVNSILENLENNYYSSKTKSYLFNEALNFVNKLF
ncbi:hypothetical protein PJJ26_05620 [Tenacibaculum finnmarkense]|nr:hypothetical protein PJJ26_05620 [Tenacibaculum finnmarkense]